MRAAAALMGAGPPENGGHRFDASRTRATGLFTMPSAGRHNRLRRTEVFGYAEVACDATSLYDC